MQLKKISDDHYVVVNENWRITHSTQPLDQVNQPKGETSLGVFMMGRSKIEHLDLSYIKSLVGEVDVEKKAELCGYPESSKFYDYKEGFVDGYQECLEDNKDKKFSEEDMLSFLQFYECQDIRNYGVFKHPTMDGSHNTHNKAIQKKVLDAFISSLTQPKDTWECFFDENNNLKLK